MTVVRQRRNACGDHSTASTAVGSGGQPPPPHAIIAVVIHRATLCTELLAAWHRDIPLAAAMAIDVDGYDGETLTVRAPLSPNRNVHGTAFAGSLFSLCVLTGWGATWLKLREAGLLGTIVVAKSTIDYHRAVTGDLVCRTTPRSDDVTTAIERFRSKGRARLPLECTIEFGGERAVSFLGQYAVLAEAH
jgi:thioesterase domain-containing protein